MLRSESLASASSLGGAEVALDDEQRAAIGAIARAAAAQDAHRVLVLPVVQDRLEHVGVGALRHRVEEAARDDLAALADDRALDDVGLVEEDAAHPGMGVEDRGEEGAPAAADVDHRREAPEVVGGEQVARWRAA